MQPHTPFNLADAAAAEMKLQGFELTPIHGQQQQLADILAGNVRDTVKREDLRELAWSSIDNDTSRDLDQIEWAERLEDGGIRVRVGVADVAATVKKDTPLDKFAARQCATIYTAARNFSMLPTELSTGLTSLNPGEDRAAMVAEFVVDADGSRRDGRIFPAMVRNTAQLAYSHVGPWLANPDATAPTLDPEVLDQLHLQDEAAQRLRQHREDEGALDFRRTESTPVVADGRVLSLEDVGRNRAMNLIEDLMIAANETVAHALSMAHRSGLRRVVKSPERWQRIVDLVYVTSANMSKRVTLPAEPDAKPLNEFLCKQREHDPDHYPDLALAIIKLMGAGEYVVVHANDPYPPSHFALAANDYAHSTAPNRRFPDLVTQRVVHAMLDNASAPYTDDELAAIAEHCNERDKAGRKVERAMLKRAQALALAKHIGQQYRAVVTGASNKGTFVRVLKPAVEGMLVRGHEGLDVGDRLNVVLVHTDPVRAFIDFARV
jgi:exoribonuclease-2